MAEILERAWISACSLSYFTFSNLIATYLWGPHEVLFMSSSCPTLVIFKQLSNFHQAYLKSYSMINISRLTQLYLKSSSSLPQVLYRSSSIVPQGPLKSSSSNSSPPQVCLSSSSSLFKSSSFLLQVLLVLNMYVFTHNLKKNRKYGTLQCVRQVLTHFWTVCCLLWLERGELFGPVPDLSSGPNN